MERIPKKVSLREVLKDGNWKPCDDEWSELEAQRIDAAERETHRKEVEE